MEYIKGENVSRLQRAAERDQRTMPLEVAVHIVHDAAHALDHAHKAVDLNGQPLSIVHRDVSPQNIMVRTDGVTKVVDFGIAKAENRSARTATGLLKGKVQYMAPEQISGQHIDGRADQFALGAVLWELCAGKKLFAGNSDIEVLRAVTQAPIPRLASAAPHVPPALDVCVGRMLQRNPAARYPTLEEAAADLRRYLDSVGMKGAQTATAAFVAQVLGDEISAKTLDLTPSRSGNFVISLSPPPTAPTRMMPSAAARASLGIAWGLIAALIVGGMASAFVLVAPSPPPEAPLVLPAPPTPEVAVAGPPVSAQRLPGPEPGSDVPKRARYTIESDPSGAAIKIRSGNIVRETGERTPHTFEDLEPGLEHRLELVLDGYLPARARVALAPGEAYREKLSLKRRPSGGARPAPLPAPVAAVPAGQGFLTVKTTPWAQISIDGESHGQTPVARIPLEAGTHTVRLVNEERGVDVTKRVKIAPNETLKQDWVIAKD
jgi:hypothetical protein